MMNVETTVHFLRHCPLFANQRLELFQDLNPIILANDLTISNDQNLIKLLLYGHEGLKFEENQRILQATLRFIGKTSRFSRT